MRKNFTLDLVNRTLTINSVFAEAVETGEGDDYKTYKRLMEDIPGLTVIRKSHKSPTSYTNKNGEKFSCNQFKNLKYKNMESFINGLPNNAEYLRAYNFLKNCGSLPLTSRYTAVRRWFVAQFPEFRKNPLFYLYNDVKVIDFVPFIQEAQREAEEKAADKAATM